MPSFPWIIGLVVIGIAAGIPLGSMLLRVINLLTSGGPLKTAEMSGIDSCDDVGDAKTPEFKQWPTKHLLLPSSVTSFHGVPEGVTDVTVNDADRLTNLAGLPNSVRTALIRDCGNLRKLKGLPLSLKELHLWRCHRVKNLRGLPHYLELVTLEHCNRFCSVQGLPEGLLLIGLVRCQRLRSLTALPSSVEGIIAAHCSITSFAGVPKRATLLTGWNYESFDIRKLLRPTVEAERRKDQPEKPFERLELPLSATSLQGVPETVSHLVVGENWRLRSLAGLPTSIRVIELIGCHVLESLDGLPEGVEVIGCRACEHLISMQKLPESLKHLMVHGCPIASFEGVPIGATVSTQWDPDLLVPASKH